MSDEVQMSIIKKTVQFGEHELILETGRIARQATGSVLVTMGGTVLLVTVVGKEFAKPGQDFFPLTVDYQEKTYAAGKIPGGFFKREGRPSEKEVLICRLIDRPIRPLFPKGFRNEVQIIATVMSLDPEVQTDVVAIIGASAALAISGMPFNGPVGAARVGFINNEYVLNPSLAQLDESELNLVVAGTDEAVLMVESEAKSLPEETMLGAVMFGHSEMQPVINAIKELKEEGGKAAWDWTPPPVNEALIASVREQAEQPLRDAYAMQDKMERHGKISEVLAGINEQLLTDAEDSPSEQEVFNHFHALEAEIVRGKILQGEARIDGRDTRTVRPISIETGILPRVHGSVLFTRGETQAIVAATLGTDRDSQLVDDITGQVRSAFMLHYNFPPFSVGECGRVGSPKRREIGHGKLAKRAMEAVVPTLEEFPYVLRVVSEITESNGSSSMATVCGTSLALMDAGVPIKAPVAGIAMGLIKEGDNFAVLTDILGDEDHLGDMDFKVAGTADGITALQMDIKIEGITEEIMKQALQQANEGRMHILGKMNAVLSSSRPSISEHAPQIITIQIKPSKIGDVIGKGGSVIRELCESTESTIDISDDGVVKIAAVDREKAQLAKQRVEELTAEAEVGKVYDGRIVTIKDFGAFVEFMPGQQGMVHISQIANERVEKVEDHLELGQIVKVQVLEIDRQGRVRLSMKAAL